ncbi:MAG: hypothetical protein IKT52_04865 [Oscillospiraceae bacterium]|nr:hypothetical protein [Oscillospiraceae bacterium]
MSNFNAFVESASNTTVFAPKFFRFNLFNDTIEGSEFNFKKAGNPASEQYVELMKMKAIQPSFKFAAIASTKKVEKKQTYAGLTLPLMSDYIRIVATEQVKAEFNHMVEKKMAYPTIKSWFLEEFKHFNVNQAKAQIAKHDLTARKAAVRTAVKVKTAKATPAVVELPNASNF